MRWSSLVRRRQPARVSGRAWEGERSDALAEPEAAVRMSWLDKGWWRPVAHHSRIGTGEELGLLRCTVGGSRRRSPSSREGKAGRNKVIRRMTIVGRKPSTTPVVLSARDFLDMSLMDSSSRRRLWRLEPGNPKRMQRSCR